MRTVFKQMHFATCSVVLVFCISLLCFLIKIIWIGLSTDGGTCTCILWVSSSVYTGERLTLWYSHSESESAVYLLMLGTFYYIGMLKMLLRFELLSMFSTTKILSYSQQRTSLLNLLLWTKSSKAVLFMKATKCSVAFSLRVLCSSLEESILSQPIKASTFQISPSHVHLPNSSRWLMIWSSKLEQ